jgi:serine/threonine-protein kinase
MAPEQARGSSEVDARSDVYSAGAVLYRMLTGRAPYGANDAGVTLVRLLEESPERARSIEKSIPEALEAILERAMARDPEARYATIDAFEREVAAFDGGGSSTVVLDGASLSGGSPDATSRRSVLAKRARSVRPLAIVAAGTASVGACLAVGVCLALLVDGLRSGGRIHDAELVLVALGALVALGSSLFASLRAIRAAWRSAPAVERLGMRYATAVAAGLLAFGLLELTARVYAVLVLHQPGAWDPLWAASRVVLAIGAGLVGAAVGRRR